MKERGKLQRLFLILCIGLLMITAGRTVRLAAADGDQTENTVAPVEVVAIDYDKLWLEANPGGNTAIYYSDKNKKVWSEAIKGADGKYLIDISWVKTTAATEITLKGDKNEDVVTVKLPAKESKYKVKFDKAKGILTFTGMPSEITNLEWRKATSYVWNPVTVQQAGDEKSSFAREIEKLRIAGASIYIRIAGTNGKVENGTLNVGTRPGKEVKVSISKFANAPNVKVDGKKLTFNTTNSMEYSTNNVDWEPASKAMTVEKLAQGALGSSAKDTVVYFRKKATSKAPHSKVCMVEVPAQRPAPVLGTDVSFKSEEKKFCLEFKNASKENPYEYAVVKPGVTFDAAKVSWKAVTTSKTISISNKTAPKDSVIYVRKRMVKQTSTTEFEIASMYQTIPVTYTESSTTTK